MARTQPFKQPYKYADPVPDKLPQTELVLRLLNIAGTGDLSAIKSALIESKLTTSVIEQTVLKNVKVTQGKTLFHMVLQNNQLSKHDKLALFKFLIETNAPFDRGDIFNIRPLHIASMKQLLEIVQLLLQYKADPNSRDNQYMTPMHYTLQPEKVECKLSKRQKKFLENAKPRVKLDIDDVQNVIYQEIVKNEAVENVVLFFRKIFASDLLYKYKNDTVQKTLNDIAEKRLTSSANIAPRLLQLKLSVIENIKMQLNSTLSPLQISPNLSSGWKVSDSSAPIISPEKVGDMIVKYENENYASIRTNYVSFISLLADIDPLLSNMTDFANDIKQYFEDIDIADFAILETAAALFQDLEEDFSEPIESINDKLDVLFKKIKIYFHKPKTFIPATLHETNSTSNNVSLVSYIHGYVANFIFDSVGAIKQCAGVINKMKQMVDENKFDQLNNPVLIDMFVTIQYLSIQLAMQSVVIFMYVAELIDIYMQANALHKSLIDIYGQIMKHIPNIWKDGSNGRSKNPVYSDDDKIIQKNKFVAAIQRESTRTSTAYKIGRCTNPQRSNCIYMHNISYWHAKTDECEQLKKMHKNIHTSMYYYCDKIIKTMNLLVGNINELNELKLIKNSTDLKPSFGLTNFSNEFAEFATLPTFDEFAKYLHTEYNDDVALEEKLNDVYKKYIYQSRIGDHIYYSIQNFESYYPKWYTIQPPSEVVVSTRKTNKTVGYAITYVPTKAAAIDIHQYFQDIDDVPTGQPIFASSSDIQIDFVQKNEPDERYIRKLDLLGSMLKYQVVTSLISSLSASQPSLFDAQLTKITEITTTNATDILWSIVGTIIDKLMIKTVESMLSLGASSFVVRAQGETSQSIADKPPTELIAKQTTQDDNIADRINDFVTLQSTSMLQVLHEVNQFETTEQQQVQYNLQDIVGDTCYTSVDPNIIAELIKHGADVNIENVSKISPLLMAVMMRNVDVVDQLLHQHCVLTIDVYNSCLEMIIDSAKMSPFNRAVDITGSIIDRVKTLTNNDVLPSNIKYVILVALYMLDHQITAFAETYPNGWSFKLQNELYQMLGVVRKDQKYPLTLMYDPTSDDSAVEGYEVLHSQKRALEKQLFDKQEVLLRTELSIKNLTAEQTANNGRDPAVLAPIIANITATKDELTRYIDSFKTKITDIDSKIRGVPNIAVSGVATTHKAILSTALNEFNPTSNNVLTIYDKIFKTLNAIDQNRVYANYDLYSGMWNKLFNRPLDNQQHDFTQIIHAIYGMLLKNSQLKPSSYRNKFVPVIEIYDLVYAEYALRYFDTLSYVNLQDRHNILTQLVGIMQHVVKHFIMPDFINAVAQQVIQHRRPSATTANNLENAYKILTDTKFLSTCTDALPTKIIKVVCKLNEGTDDPDAQLELTGILNDTVDLLKLGTAQNIDDAVIATIKKDIVQYFKTYIEITVFELYKTLVIQLKTLIDQQQLLKILLLLSRKLMYA